MAEGYRHKRFVKALSKHPQLVTSGFCGFLRSIKFKPQEKIIPDAWGMFDYYDPIYVLKTALCCVEVNHTTVGESKAVRKRWEDYGHLENDLWYLKKINLAVVHVDIERDDAFAVWGIDAESPLRAIRDDIRQHLVDYAEFYWGWVFKEAA